MKYYNNFCNNQENDSSYKLVCIFQNFMLMKLSNIYPLLKNLSLLLGVTIETEPIVACMDHCCLLQCNTLLSTPQLSLCLDDSWVAWMLGTNHSDLSHGHTLFSCMRIWITVSWSRRRYV